MWFRCGACGCEWEASCDMFMYLHTYLQYTYMCYICIVLLYLDVSSILSAGYPSVVCTAETVRLQQEKANINSKLYYNCDIQDVLLIC